MTEMVTTDRGEPWQRYRPPAADTTAADLETGGLTEAEGWARYNGCIEEVRQLILTSPLTNHDPRTRAQALFILPQIQAQAFLLAVASRPDFPRFYTHEFFQPGVFTYNLPCPDFVYRTTFLDGRRTYRITGTRQTASWVDFQCFNCFSGVGAANPKRLGNWDLDDFMIAEDGRFEITVSAAPAAGNWIRLDSASRFNWLNIRQLAYEGEQPPEMTIETVGDGPPKEMYPDEAELARRLALGGEIVKYIVTRMTYARVQETVLKQAGGTNQFHVVSGKDEKEAKDGGNPMAVYEIAVFEIAPDEALIFEADPPKARYWNVHVGDILNQTRDYVHHKSSINDRQAVPDSDGKIRVVLSFDDPGVPNWLDPVGSGFGRVVWRWYGADRVEVPKITRIKRSALRAHLPADAQLISPAERTEELARRRRFVSALYGY